MGLALSEVVWVVALPPPPEGVLELAWDESPSQDRRRAWMSLKRVRRDGPSCQHSVIKP